MEFIDKKTIRLDKEINELDKFVFDFLKILEKHTNYVIISGYVAVLFGRSRTTEDVDIFIEKIDFEKFQNIFDELIKNGYWAINSDSAEDLFQILEEDSSIRFAKKSEVAPNMEIKFMKKETDFYSMENKIKVLLGNESIFVSPLELEIAFKLFLGSQKDIEDARHIYNVVKDKIDREELNKFIILLKVEKLAGEHLHE